MPHSHLDRQRTPVRPLPGSDEGASAAGMANYVITLKQSAEQAAVTGRVAVYSSNIAQTGGFQERLRRWLIEHDLADQVLGIGEPMGFPMVTLTGTPEVAKKIEADFPEVESIFRDGDSLQAIT